MSDRASRLAIVTGHIAPELSDGGKRVAAALADRGIESDPVMWDDPSVDWAGYDGVLVRSCWDYPDDRERFRAMLAELDRAGVPVCNALSVIRWNLHKRYLLDLADRGVRIPPTVLLEQGADVSLGAILRRQGWTDAVVKPAVGARSEGVWRTSPDEEGSAGRFDDLLASGDVLVQAYVPEIEAGERSIVFLDGTDSHAWNSLMGEDVTAFEGVEVDPDYEPSPAVRERAGEVLAAARDALGLDAALPYARVDYVERGDDLLLVELELIEPYLGFERAEGAVERFCEAVVSYFEDRDAFG